MASGRGCRLAPSGRSASGLDGLDDHPVVHVNWFEAQAYAGGSGVAFPPRPSGRRLRDGLDQALYAWGDELTPGGEHRCNIWQGTFPTENALDDGWGYVSVGTYEPNGFGLVDVAGNVWEWTSDWWDERAEARAMRGGSYLCHDSYCNRYRVGARSSNTPDTRTAISASRRLGSLELVAPRRVGADTLDRDAGHADGERDDLAPLGERNSREAPGVYATLPEVG